MTPEEALKQILRSMDEGGPRTRTHVRNLAISALLQVYDPNIQHEELEKMYREWRDGQ